MDSEILIYPQELLDREREAFERLAATAMDYPVALIEDLQKDTSNAQLGEEIKKIAKLCARMSTHEQLDALEKFCRKFPKGRRAHTRVWNLAIQEEIRRLALESEENEERRRRSNPDEMARAPSRIVETSIGFYEKELQNGDTVRVSSFSFVVTRRVASVEPGEPARLAVRVIDPRMNTLVEEWVIPAKAWTSKRAFVASFPHDGMQWYGSDDDVQALHEHLTAGVLETLPMVRATNVIGYHEIAGSPRFVLPAGTLGADGRWMQTPDLLYLPAVRAGTLLTRLPQDKHDAWTEQARTVAREALPSLFQIAPPNTIATIAGWFAASIFKSRIMRKLGGFPILNIAAEGGSGKSSLATFILWPMFCGVERGEPMSAAQTPFATQVDLASSNAIAVIFDELKSDLGRLILQFLRYLRGSWNGEVETRGHADQSTTSRALVAPVCVMGETALDMDAATKERLARAELDKGWLMAHPEARATFKRLSTLPLHLVGIRLLGWSLSVDVDALLVGAEDDVAAFLAEHPRLGLPPRVQTTLTAVGFGLRLLAAYAAHEGVSLPALVPAPAVFETMLREAYGEGDEDVDFDIAASTDHLDTFLVLLSRAAVAGKLPEETCYAWIEGKLFIALNPAYGELQRLAGERREEWHLPGAAALGRIARRKQLQGGYVINSRHQLTMGEDRRPRGILIDTAKIPASVGVEEFPMRAVRTHGGGGKRILSGSFNPGDAAGYWRRGNDDGNGPPS